MRTLTRLGLFGAGDVIRSRLGVGYLLFFLAVGEGMFRFNPDSGRVLLSLINVTLFIIPLVCLVFGSAYFYNSRDFVDMLLTQPLKRSTVFLGLYGGLSTSLALGFLVGVGLPFLWHGGVTSENVAALITLVGCGVFLTYVFTALAFLIAVVAREKSRGLVLAILTWLLLGLVYDGAVLYLVHAFSDYPIERPMIALTLLNPIDLARILILLQVDISALLGYTGALFKRLFSDSTGLLVISGCLSAWLAAPIWLATNRFRKSDL